MNIQDALHLAIKLELNAQEQRPLRLWRAVDKIEILGERPGQFIYRIALGEEVRVTPDTEILLRIPGHKDPVRALVLFAAQNSLMVSSQEPLPQQVTSVRIEFDPKFILRKLDAYLEQVLQSPPAPLKILISKNIPGPEYQHDTLAKNRLLGCDRLNSCQFDSVLRMQADKVHLLWGPPGTGKTHTLGMSIAEHLGTNRSCLLLSTSNAAVDEIVRAAARAMSGSALQHVFRAGYTDDAEVQEFTFLGLYERWDATEAARARKAASRLREITQALSSRAEFANVDGLAGEIGTCRKTVRDFTENAKAFGDQLLRSAQCVASTLATLVINPILRDRQFDVVYIDESSMVSLPFAFAGAAKGTEQVIFAGDFKQLPPICNSDLPQAKRWFGANIFEYLGIRSAPSSDNLPPYVSMLKEQYRMTESIASVVSELSYGGKLISRDQAEQGPPPVFVDLSELRAGSPYSVSEGSYYQPWTAVLLALLAKKFNELFGPTNLLLTPFRAQRVLLQAIGQDLKDSERSFEASTIHKAQGSEENTVIVDLTAHLADSPQKFFRNEEAENLINVALSRAQKRLLILGNSELVRSLAEGGEYWRKFQRLVQDRCVHISAASLLSKASACGFRFTIGEDFKWRDFPSLYVESDWTPCPQGVRELFSRTGIGKKLIVLSGKERQPPLGDGITYRQVDQGVIPPLMTWQGVLFLPMETSPLSCVKEVLPSTTRKLASIACGHLYDSQFDVKRDTFRLVCPKCLHPLRLERNYGQYRLQCQQRPDCFYSRPLKFQDAQTIIEVQDLRCPKCNARP